MMMTSLVVSLCCCCLFLLTPAKSEPGRSGQVSSSLTARKPKDEADRLAFCPIDKKTSKQINATRAILKKKTPEKLAAITRQEKAKKTPRRVVRQNTELCEWPYPECAVVAMRVLDEEGFASHTGMAECCVECRDKKFRECKQKKTCVECIKERITCFNQCVVTHFCREIRRHRSEAKGSKEGKAGTKGAKGAPGPGAKIDLCPTTKVRTSSGSSCIKRSCYPIKL